MRDHPPTVEWWGARFETASIPTDSPLVGTLKGTHTNLTRIKIHIGGVPYGADIRFLVYIGKTPEVLFGPVDIRNSRRPDEFVPVEDLFIVVRTLVLTALRFCGGQLNRKK